MRQNNVRRYAAFGFGIGELLFYGGIVYGWSTLVFVLKADGYYSYLCKNETIDILSKRDSNVSKMDTTPPTCSEQDALLNLVFTVAAFSLQGSMFFTGALFDYFGTRFTRLFLQ